MNRAERRRIEKAKSKVHVVTKSQDMYNNAFLAGMKQGILEESGMTARMFVTVMAAVLHDEFGFGEKRLRRILEHIGATLEAINWDSDHERKLRQWIQKETGIDLDDYTGGRTIELRKELQEMYDMGVVKK